MPVFSSIFSAYADWKSEMPSSACATSMPRKYESRPKSLIVNMSFICSLNIATSSALEPVMIKSSTYTPTSSRAFP
uniref:Uncharacterized protein n=1 Tax=Triticum urartu TaxID=4572 RepID=A0A8R7UNJ0_TRIUA